MALILVYERIILDGVCLAQQPHVGFVARDLGRHLAVEVVALCVGLEENGGEAEVVWVMVVVERVVAVLDGDDVRECADVKGGEVGKEVEGGGITTCRHVVCELGDVGLLHGDGLSMHDGVGRWEYALQRLENGVLVQL